MVLATILRMWSSYMIWGLHLQFPWQQAKLIPSYPCRTHGPLWIVLLPERGGLQNKESGFGYCSTKSGHYYGSKLVEMTQGSGSYHGKAAREPPVRVAAITDERVDFLWTAIPAEGLSCSQVYGGVN